MSKNYYIYILTNERNGTLYIGVTNNLVRRLYEHQNGLVDGFTKKYKVKMLVYFESTEDVISAIAREKAMKKWSRSWKISLIQSVNL